MLRSDSLSNLSADQAWFASKSALITEKSAVEAVCRAIASAVRNEIAKGDLPYPLPVRLPSGPAVKPVDDTLLYTLVAQYLKDNPEHAHPPTQPLQPRVVSLNHPKTNPGIQVEVSHHDFHYLVGVFSDNPGGAYLLQGRGARLEDESHLRLMEGRLDWPNKKLEGNFIHPQLETQCPQLSSEIRSVFSVPFLTKGCLTYYDHQSERTGVWRVLPNGGEWCDGTETFSNGRVMTGVWEVPGRAPKDCFRAGEVRYPSGAWMKGTFKDLDENYYGLDFGYFYHENGMLEHGTFGIDSRLANGKRTYQGWTWHGDFEWVEALNDVKLKQGSRTPPPGGGPEERGAWAYIPELGRMALVSGVVLHAKDVPMGNGKKGDILTRGQYQYVEALSDMGLVKGDMHLLTYKKEGPLWEYVKELKKMELKEGRTELPNGQVQVGKFAYISALKAMHLVEGTIVYPDGLFESGRFEYVPGLKKMHLVEGTKKQDSTGRWAWDPVKKGMVFSPAEDVKKLAGFEKQLVQRDSAQEVLTKAKAKPEVKKPDVPITNVSQWGPVYRSHD
jgi:hypothetical protein